MSSFIDNYVSITQLQKNTNSCLENINEVGMKVVLSNNKPKAIILSLSEFEYISKKWQHFIEPDEWEKQAIGDYEKRKKMWKTSYIVADKNYFNTLK